MNIEYLKSFIIVTEQKSYSKAADLLFVTQPALTKQIKRLEEEIGCKLFARNTRNMELTESGEIFFRHAVRIVNEYEKMCRYIQEQKDMEYGSLKVGYVLDMHRKLAEKTIVNFADQYPGLEISVTRDLPPALITMLRKGEVDCAIMHMPSAMDERGIDFKQLKAGGLTARMSPDCRLAKRKSVSVKDLEDFEILTSRNGCPKARDFADFAFVQNNVEMHRRYVDNQETVELLSAGKNMISLTSEHNHVEGLVQVPIVELDSGFDIVLAYRTDNENPYVDRLFKVLRRDL